ncbi:MAG: hypothetical protein Q8927_00435 [Bacteroidota bacterium]|nr:hypothetical protein [Bacteroidota bacterium]MDP4244711.1 hypothetical protein [Bacteroidota bacterium]
MPGSPPRPRLPDQPPALRVAAQVISWVFHPLFVTSYVIAFLIFVHPYVFEGYDHRTRVQRLLTVVLTDTLFPAFSVFLIWKLQFIRSMHLRTARERIIPYMITMIFYWWTWHVYGNIDVPPVSVHFLLGTFLAVCAAWFCNIYFKISMHAIAMGGMVLFIYLLANLDSYPSGLYLSVAVLVAGTVCTARLICSDHTRFEVWSGLFVGMLAMWVGWQF